MTDPTLIDAEPDTALFRKAMASFLSGVTLVTTYTEAGEVVGLTASAFSSVSLDPPLVLVCPSRSSQTYPHILRTGRFAIHILSGEQTAIAYLFAKSGNDSSHLAWQRSRHGNPVLAGALCTLECRVWAEYDGGDHAILVGRVLAIDLPESVSTALLYGNGQLSAHPVQA